MELGGRGHETVSIARELAMGTVHVSDNTWFTRDKKKK